jgi:hypothetical protein
MVSHTKKDFLMQWFDRFLFPMDKVTIKDITSEFNILTLIGSQAKSILSQLTPTPLQDFPAGGHQWLTFNANDENINADINANILCATGNSLKIAGYTLYVPANVAVAIWQKISDLGVIPMGETAWEKLRIHQGRPAPDKELTEDYNPLEAGLWDCISFDKGCYIGQETIARLNTYKGVKQRLFGITFPAPVEPDTQLTIAGERAGRITSVDPETNFALGYIRTKMGGAGLTVTADNADQVEGQAIALPYVSHVYPDEV